MFVQTTSVLCNVQRLVFAAVLAATAGTCNDASAQWPSTRIVSPGASGYQHVGGGFHRNPWNNSTYIPGVAAVKPSGVYQATGTGYYVNQDTGNIYNPSTGSYTQGKNLSIRDNNYQGNGFIRHNPNTGSFHIPGAAVVKPSGVYTPMGNGYYRNQSSGNVYNPTTGAYKSR